MINRLKMKNYEKISLSVQKNNYAFKMYLKCGFEIIKETNEEYIMICELDK
jgi:ribosomal protein S18 acetylase RimI-like enzyme